MKLFFNNKYLMTVISLAKFNMKMKPKIFPKIIFYFKRWWMPNIALTQCLQQTRNDHFVTEPLVNIS